MRARIATGLILAAAAAVLTLWAPVWLFAVLVLAVMLAALVEWSRLRPTAVAGPPVVIVMPLIMSLIIIGAAILLFRAPQKLPLVCLAGGLFWVYLAFELVKGIAAAPGNESGIQPTPSNNPGSMASLVSLIQGGFIFLFAWCALLWMRLEQGAAMTIALLVVVWSADTFAYLAGRRFGKRKLAPSISPGKTIEGLAGGLAGAGLVALLAAIYALDLSPAQTLIWLLASLVAALFSVVGDLFESRLKRRAGVKDSGGLLPGHGGVLDRIDGLLAAAPVFATVWRLAG